ncbi:MAG: TonB-dependent receptor [Betaproteobacteria bacterium]|nr:TonB-dependent receptor [Betaproteobacteria bacterium]
MTQQRRFKLHACASAAIAALSGSMLAAPALAQSGDPSLGRVEITGSNIRRAQAETAAPVQVITREDIDKSGKTSVAEYLQTLTADNQGSVPMTFGNGFAVGASGISLRGLGAQSTLVLINGRRIAPYGLADDGQKVFADLNVIPLEAVERVEVLKDGASAIYGSDAIAGVVNVILRKNFQGTVGKASFGQSRYGDGTEKVASITHGFSNEKEGLNALFSVELRDKEAIYSRDRAGRDMVGSADYRPIGGNSSTITNFALGGFINPAVGIGSSLVGNVRRPGTVTYFSRSDTSAATGFTRAQPGANCGPNFSLGTPQNDPVGNPGGGCLVNATQQYGQIQPSQRTANLFGRLSKQVNKDLEVYTELSYYNSDARAQSTPSGISGSTGSPLGPVSNTAVALGGLHPDNPYTSAARFRYLAGDVGPRVSNVESSFSRVLLGAKGTLGAWDFDSAFLHSATDVKNVRTGYLQRDVLNALLDPTGSLTVPGKTNAAVAAANSPAYAALPAGTYWRIAENAGLNSAALYAALSPAITSNGKASTTSVDFKVNREVGKLEGGPIGVALGAELRRETTTLTPTTGTERGNIIGLGYSAYDGSRTVAAAYAEALFPVTKQVEINTALRMDKYSGSLGTSVTPKVGLKWTPARNFALRGTYAQGFRAPGAPESSSGGVALSAFSSATDPARCAAGVTAACSPQSVAILTSGNAGIKPEKSESMTIGMVWDVTPQTSVMADLWQIKRTNEINQETTSAAIAAGRVVRDPLAALPSVPGDPGPITAVLAGFVNSSSTTVRGLDVDARHRIDLGGGNGRLTFNATWTHLFSFKRVDPDGTVYEWAGTMGNHDVTNAIGTPKDRVSLGATWDAGQLRLAAIANFRGSMQDKFEKSEECIDHSPLSTGCKIKSFYTVDVSALWRLNKNTEVFGVVRNLLDKKPPLDITTYGAVNYNPLDYMGAVGRYFSVGLRHRF